MRRIEVAKEILLEVQAYAQENPHLKVIEVGQWAKDKWPNLFTATAMSAWKHIQREGAAQQILITLPCHKRVPPNQSEWADKTPELVVPFKDRVLVISDPHFSSHDVDLVERWLQVVEAWQPHYIVWNGDFLNFDHFGFKGKRDAFATHFAEDLKAHAAVMHQAHELSPDTEHLILQGNHDDKALRVTDGELPFDQWLRAMWAQYGCWSAPEVQITSRYYLIMEPMSPSPWPFTGPENFPTLFAHQKEYSRLPLGVSGRLADVKWCNVVSGHHHHLGVTQHKSGLVWQADAGTMQCTDSPRYKNERPSTHPKWAQGFLLLEYGVPTSFHNLSPASWWDKQLERLNL